MKYTTPSLRFFEVVAEQGYGNSVVTLPGLGTESDDLIVTPAAENKE
jgi:hypothetical protein